MKKLLVIGILVLTLGTGVGIAGVPCAILPTPAGWSMIANPCNGGVTPISVFLPAAGVPGGTMLYKYNGVTFDLEVNVGGLFWFPDLMTLSPGEGAFIDLPVAAALGFGGVPLVGPNIIALGAGFTMCSPPSGLGLFAFPAAEGDMIFKFINASGTYDIYEVIFGAWEPAPPVIAVGESFWVLKSAPALWVQ
jgi:hypothetical protein